MRIEKARKWQPVKTAYGLGHGGEEVVAICPCGERLGIAPGDGLIYCPCGRQLRRRVITEVLVTEEFPFKAEAGAKSRRLRRTRLIAKQRPTLLGES